MFLKNQVIQKNYLFIRTKQQLKLRIRNFQLSEVIKLYLKIMKKMPLSQLKKKRKLALTNTNNDYRTFIIIFLLIIKFIYRSFFFHPIYTELFMNILQERFHILRNISLLKGTNCKFGI